MEVIRVLLEHGAGVNAQDKDKLMPLHYVLQGRHAQVAWVLLERGADVGAQSKSR